VTLPAGVGLGWRPETAWLIDRRRRIAFTEVVAENVAPDRPSPARAAAVERGLVAVAHGVSLNLGGAEPPGRARIARLAKVARALRAPLVSEHVSFSRAGELESPHFLPVPRTRPQLAVLVDHVARVAGALDVPLALENVAAPLAWPGDELAEADFLAELVDRTGTLLLLDVANLHANLVNHGGDLDAYLARLPLERIAYLHAAGGARVGGDGAMWRDTHAHPIGPGLLDTLGAVLARTGPRPILLERDHAFPTREELEGELDALEAVLATATAPASAPAARAPAPGAPLPPPLPRVDGALRRALAERHDGLLRALLADAAAPPGFQPAHMGEARAILEAKQARACRTRSRASSSAVAHVAD
jgi:uncharacterized protein (UPF0276 family)